MEYGSVLRFGALDVLQTGSSLMARNGSKSVAKFGHDVSYLSFGETHYGRVHVSLEPAGLKVADVSSLVKAIEGVDIVSGVTPSILDGTIMLSVGLTPVGSSEYGSKIYDSPERRTQLMNYFAPKSVRKASATAVVARDVDGKHLQTQVTMSLMNGELFTTVDDPRVLNGKGGVLRARIADGGHKLVFTMNEPVIDDVDDLITEVIKYVASEVKTMYTGALSIQDRNPDASLNPSNDFASSDNS